jgi:hypothetical protein
VEESSVGLSKALSHKDSGLLDVVQCRLLRRPRRKDCVTLKINVLGTFETSINIYESARRDIPKDITSASPPSELDVSQRVLMSTLSNCRTPINLLYTFKIFELGFLPRTP